MAGPAIRSVELARALAREHEVTVVTPQPSDLEHTTFETGWYTSERDLLRMVNRCDVVITVGSFLEQHSAIARTDKVIVADLYDPVMFEALVMHAADPMDWQVRVHRGALRGQRLQLERADLFLCASERQRHLVLGMLTAAGRINPSTYGADPTLRDLVRIVPFGLPAPPPPIHRPGPLRKRLGLAADDLVVLWGGGIYEWLDPLSLIEALAGIGTDRIKAFFIGTAHPTPEVPAMPIAAQAHARARELGVLDRTVFFGDGWIPYDERAGYLLDADVGVSLHRDHIETTFAFRTRMLDYIWAGLPILCSDGDAFADLVRKRQIGEVVPIGDVPAIRSALLRLMEAPYRDRLHRPLRDVATELRWDTVVAPVMEFCRSPARAPDQLAPYRKLRRRVEIGERVHGLLARLVPSSGSRKLGQARET
jgi:glycosyltransferase involved in cell wall biosynthesis